MQEDTESQSVLVVDDSEDIHQLVNVRLRSEHLHLLHAYDADEALEMMQRINPDLILLDLDMPGTNGLTLCNIMKNTATLKHIPVIFLTGNLDVETKVKAFDLGAVDYVTKPFDGIELKARVRAALRTKRYHDLLTTKARIDGLTGLWNRGYFDEQLSSEVSLLHRSARPVALLMVDIDHFKPVNDTHGHPFGDQVIQRVARTINNLSRDSDIACRYGGEEFCIILRDTGSDGAIALAERMREAIAALRFKSGAEFVSFTVSIGVSSSDSFKNRDSLTGSELLEASDKALYAAKSNGRDRVESA